MQLLIGILILSLGLFEHAWSADGKNTSIPNLKARRSMILNLASEMVRLDGDGLIPRKNRRESWGITIQRLAKEAEKSQTLYDLGRVFNRLDATYPNLHAKVFLIPEIDEIKTEGSVILPITFAPVIIDRKIKESRFQIIIPSNYKGDFETEDELVSINSRPIREWADENFIFCKFPQREQCEMLFFKNFSNELLSWNRHQALEFKVLRKGRQITISIKPEIKKFDWNEESHDKVCGVLPNRYKEFKLAYEGENLCAFEFKKDPHIVALRIKSFRYQESAIAGVEDEVEKFWNIYWSKKSPSVKTLILDVIDNHGGDSPTAYYALFYSHPFQELYVQFKKIAELEREDILQSLFWGDKGKEIWFENIKKDGSLSRLKIGEFLAPIPQFCSSSKKDCRDGLFEPRKNGFTGKVKVLMNHWCVSSCVGFVSNIKNLLKEKVKTYGIPDSGDSAYSRLAVLVSPSTEEGAKVVVAAAKKARHPDAPEAWVRQIVSATRSTDKNGRVLSGRPQKIDVWVPRTWNQSNDDWAASVFDKAVGR